MTTSPRPCPTTMRAIAKIERRCGDNSKAMQLELEADAIEREQAGERCPDCNGELGHDNPCGESISDQPPAMAAEGGEASGSSVGSDSGAKAADSASPPTSSQPSAPAEGGALLPCPFCGGEAKAKHIEYQSGDSIWRVSCPSCVVGFQHFDKEFALMGWNRRASPAPGMDALDRVGVTNNRGAEKVTAASGGYVTLEVKPFGTADCWLPDGPLPDGRTVVRPAAPGEIEELLNEWRALPSEIGSENQVNRRRVGDRMAVALERLQGEVRVANEFRDATTRQYNEIYVRAEAAEQRVAELERALDGALRHVTKEEWEAAKEYDAKWTMRAGPSEQRMTNFVLRQRAKLASLSPAPDNGEPK